MFLVTPGQSRGSTTSNFPGRLVLFTGQLLAGKVLLTGFVRMQELFDSIGHLEREAQSSNRRIAYG